MKIEIKVSLKTGEVTVTTDDKVHTTTMDDLNKKYGGGSSAEHEIRNIMNSAYPVGGFGHAGY